MTLRTYAPMRRVSRKREQGQEAWQAVYRQVDQRSEGQCEVWLDGIRCPKRARDHHHLVKPRASNHVPWLVIAMCRDHHDRCEWPYKRGRLHCLTVALCEEFRMEFNIVYAKPLA